jgi:hypothetical protein
MDDYVRAMDFQEEEKPDALLTHVIHGLAQEALIDKSCASGPKELIARTFRIDVPSSGILYSSCAMGLQLYLTAHGKGDTPLNRFFLEELPATGPTGLTLPSGAKCYEK